MPQTPVTDYTKISTTVAGAQFAPAIAVLSGGGYVIVWQDSSAGAIYAQRFSATGQPVGNELHLDSTQGGSPLWVSVAATANDGFVIAFQAGGFAQAEIFGHRYDSLNNPVGGLFAVNSTSPNEQFNPHIVTLDGGGLLFTWDTQAFDVFQEVRGRIFLPDGQALGNDFVIAPMSATDQHGLSAIAPLPGGGFVVTWQRAANSGTNFEIVGQRYTSSGAATGAEFQVNTQAANNQYGNDVARLSDGGFVVSWIDPVPGNGGGRVVARHYDASGVAIGGEILIDSKASGAYGRTVVTALADGGYVVGWTEDDGANNNVLARAMGSNDVPLDAAFEIAFDSPFNANYFSDGAVTLPNGNVVFAWDGPSVGTGTGEDVYMRMYEISASTPPPGVGGPGPDTLNGTSGDDTLNGMGGDDILNGMDGNDTLIGGPGNDTMAGGGGDDRYVLDSTADIVIEAAGQGYDIVYTTASYFLDEGSSVEVLSALDSGSTNAMTLVGNSFDNWVHGNNGANFLSGGTIGASGIDRLVGLGGDDRYIVDNAADLVVEGAGQGYDIVYTTVSYALDPGNSIEVLSALDPSTTNAMNLRGNELNNWIHGNDGANILSGGYVGASGIDRLVGFGGDDRYIVDDASDLVVEAGGQGFDVVYATTSYVLDAGNSIEVLSALEPTTTNAMNLTGNDLDNILVGNSGANLLDGKGGSDVLHGTNGADSFAFTTALGLGNVDMIVDFLGASGGGDDKILLDDAAFAGLTVGTLGAGAFVLGTAAQDADDRIIYDTTTGALYFDADGTGAGAAVQFATLSGHPALAAGDFSVI